MKITFYIALFLMTCSPQAQSSALSSGESELMKLTNTFIAEADSLLEKVEKLSPEDPMHSQREKLTQLILARKDAAERIKKNIGDDGRLRCYNGSADDLTTIRDFAERMEDLQKELPKTHTNVGHITSYVIGTKAVQKIGNLMGYCYKDGVAVNKNN